jgi:GNAT superfamily N-acetyltransferase
MPLDAADQTITYREISIDDYPAAIELRAAMVRELSLYEPDSTHPGWRDRYQTFYRSRADRGDAALFFAENQGSAIGMSAVYMASTHRTEIFLQRQAYVSNVYVRPAWRRRGIARRLTGLTIEWARMKKCQIIRLRPSDVGRPVYEALGFKQSEEMELPLK